MYVSSSKLSMFDIAMPRPWLWVAAVGIYVQVTLPVEPLAFVFDVYVDVVGFSFEVYQYFLLCVFRQCLPAV